MTASRKVEHADEPVVLTPGVASNALQTQAVRGSLWSLFSTAGSLPVSLASVVVAGRALGPGAFGQYSLYIFYVTVGLLVLDLGLSNSQTWAATAGRAADHALLVRSLRGTMAWNCSKLPFALIGGIWLLQSQPGAAVLLCLGLIAQMLSQGLSVAVTADRRYGALANISFTNTFVGSLGLCVAALETASPEWAIAGLWVGRIAAAPLFYILTPKELRAPALTPGSIRMDRESVVFGGSSYISSLLSTWVASRSELVFLKRTGDSLAQGRFALATTVAMRSTLLADALYGALGIAMLAVRSADGANFLRAFRRSLRLTTLLAMATSASATAAAALLAPPLFGRAFGAVVFPTAFLLQVALLRTAWQPLFSWVYSERVNRALLMPSAVAVGVDLGLSLWLIPGRPFTGAIIANGSSSLVFLFVLAATASLPPVAVRELVRCTARLALVASVSTGALYLPIPGPLFIRAVVATSFSLVLNIIILRFLPALFEPSELVSVRASIPSKLRPLFNLLIYPVDGRADRFGRVAS